jgi:hypothetical protein
MCPDINKLKESDKMKDVTIYNDKQVYMVRSLRLMMYLVRQGFDIIKVRDSDTDSKYKIFYFDYSPEIDKVAKYYIRNKIMR